MFNSEYWTFLFYCLNLVSIKDVKWLEIFWMFSVVHPFHSFSSIYIFTFYSHNFSFFKILFHNFSSVFILYIIRFIHFHTFSSLSILLHPFQPFFILTHQFSSFSSFTSIFIHDPSFFINFHPFSLFYSFLNVRF